MVRTHDSQRARDPVLLSGGSVGSTATSAGAAFAVRLQAGTHLLLGKYQQSSAAGLTAASATCAEWERDISVFLAQWSTVCHTEQ